MTSILLFLFSSPLGIFFFSLSGMHVLMFDMIRFVELGAILEPGRPPKTDKAAILIDAVRMVSQLRGEAQIKELKVNFFYFLLNEIVLRIK